VDGGSPTSWKAITVITARTATVLLGADALPGSQALAPF
jgi:hypothetical protein